FRLVPVVTARCIFFRTRAMGAIGTRPSLLPLFLEGKYRCKARVRNAPRDRRCLTCEAAALQRIGCDVDRAAANATMINSRRANQQLSKVANTRSAARSSVAPTQCHNLDTSSAHQGLDRFTIPP